MAAIFTNSMKSNCCSVVVNAVILVFLFLCLSLPAAESKELIVGGEDGWAMPPAKYKQFYNNWASRNRFQANDTLRFKYQKDSVMAVAADEYEHCRSSHPMFFDNNGDTVFSLDRPGLYYFISGVAGHCKRGLKMIVKVLDPPSPPQAAADHSSSPSASASPAADGFIPVVFAISSLLFRL